MISCIGKVNQEALHHFLIKGEMHLYSLGMINNLISSDHHQLIKCIFTSFKKINHPLLFSIYSYSLLWLGMSFISSVAGRMNHL